MKKNAFIASCIITASIALYFGQHYASKAGMASAVQQCCRASTETTPMDCKQQADLLEKTYGNKYDERPDGSNCKLQLETMYKATSL